MPKEEIDSESNLASAKMKKENDCQVINYILDLLADQNNPLNISQSFADKNDVLSFFGSINIYRLYSLFEGEGTKKDLKDFQSKINQLKLKPYLFGQMLVNQFNKKAITSRDAKFIGIFSAFQARANEHYGSDETPAIYLFKILPALNFEHIKGEFENVSLEASKPENMGYSNYLFIKEYINFLNEDYEINEFLSMKNEPLFHQVAFAVYNKAFEIGCYKFDKSDIEIFKSCKLSLRIIPDFFTIGSSFSSNSSNLTLCFNKIINELIKMFHSKELSIADIKNFICPHEKYINILKEFPALIEIESFLACASLENINRPRGIYSGIGFEKNTVEVKSAIEYLPYFNECNRNSIVLTYICDQINEKNNYSELLSLLELFSFDKATEKEISLYDDINSLLRILDKKEFVPKDMGEICYSFLLNLRGLYTEPLFKFIHIESDDWWDYGSKEIPNSLEFLPHDSLKEYISSDDYKRYESLISNCIDKGFHQLVASQSSFICGLSHTIWDFEPMHTKLLHSIEKLSNDDISLLSKGDSHAAYYLSSLRNKDLAGRISKAITMDSKQWIGDDLSTKELSRPNIEIISENLDTFSKCLSEYGNDQFFDIYNVFANVIGRQERKVSDRTVIMSRCISNAINHNVIGFKKNTISIDIAENSDHRRYSYAHDQYSERQFIRNHFPRLKAGWAFQQIHMIFNYLKSINLHEQSIDKINNEGIFHHENKIYVFGEFSWDKVLINPLLEGDITTVVILTSGIDYNEDDESEDNYFVEVIELTLNEFAIATVLSCFEALTINTFSIGDMLSECGFKGFFQKEYSRALPFVSHEGIELNRKE